jgi:hypothetical protein
MPEFEYDEAKRRETLEKHGVDVLDAALMFERPTEVLIWEDKREDYGERRFIAVGPTDKGYRQLVYTPRGDRKRLITAWMISEEQYGKYKARLAEATKGNEE